MIFSLFDKAFYLNCHLLPVAYPPNVLSNPGDRRQMSVRHSCALENREVDEKITANIPMQRRVVGPVKKVYGCRLARFCVCSQNQGQQVGPAFEKTSVTGTIRARGLVHLGACDSVPGAVANTASRAKSYMKKKKKGGFHVRRRVRTRALQRCYKQHLVTIYEPRNGDRCYSLSWPEPARSRPLSYVDLFSRWASAFAVLYR
jgi:hypothetical protein